jgi:hypothetical protein
MSRKNQHVIRHPEGWAVKGEGNSRATKIFTTQWEAIEFGRIVAMNQRSELLIHNRKGEVRDRKDYRNYMPYPRYGYSLYPSFLSGLNSTPTPQSKI